jgi:two-component system, LytTR family, response regulator
MSSSPVTVVICDDEPLAREALRDLVAAEPRLVPVGEAADGTQALKLVRSLKPQLVFMDIQMPGLTGLQVVQQLAGTEPWPAIVFTTAYDQHAVTAFELHAADYLLKPFSGERFAAAVERVLETTAGVPASLAEAALQSRADAPLERILVRDRGQIFPLKLSEISVFRSDSKYTAISARGSQFYVRVTLAELEPRLPPGRFVRVHRNAIVNLDFVVSMKPDDQSQLELTLADGSTVLANRDASKALRDSAL